MINVSFRNFLKENRKNTDDLFFKFKRCILQSYILISEMKERIDNILELIRVITRSDICLLIESVKDSISYISSSGTAGLKKNKLDKFLKDLIRTEDFNSVDIKKISSIQEISPANKINSAHITNIKGDKYGNKTLLILFSKEKNAFEKSLIEKITPAVNLLNKELSQNNFLQKREDIVYPLRNMNIALLITNKEGRKVFANNKFEEIFGTPSGKNKSLEFSALRFFNEENKELKYEDLPFAAAVKSGSNITDKKIKYISDKGEEKWFKINSILLNDETEEINEVLSTFEDITKLMEAEIRFKETAEKIESVLYSVNGKGSEYYFITDAVKRIFGYSAEEVYSNRFRILRHILPEHFAKFRRFINELKEGNQAVVEYIIKDKEGNKHHVRHSGIPIVENEEVVRIVGVINDITDEKKIREKLEKSKEEFRLLIETADDLIFNLNSFGYFVMVNRNGALALGYNPDEMVNRHFLEFVEENNKAEIAVAFQKILNSDGVTSFEANFVDKFDKNIIFEIQARPTKSKGKISGMLGIGRDITRRRKDENKLKELNVRLIEANRINSIERDRAKQQISVLEELNKLKNEFISNVSHELRTPLASIVGFAETLSSDPDLPKDMVTEFNGIILTEGKRLAKLINDVLDFSRLESQKENLNLIQFDLIGLLRDLIRIFDKQAQEKLLTLTHEFPEAEILIYADRERLSKAFGNLIANAIKFTNSGGRVTIIAQDFLKEVEVIISDTGIGIPEEDIHSLFQKFSKVNRPGSHLPGAGFGLVTAEQIINLHKGLIRVKSEIDKGTTFIVKLPKKINER